MNLHWRVTGEGLRLTVTSRLWLFLQAFATTLFRQSGFIRGLALWTILVQIVLCIFGAVNRIMLFGDGSFFTYALATGHAWELKWQFLITRFATYLLTVLPTEAICGVISCTGPQIASINSAIFYFVPTLQFGYVVFIAWGTRPQLLFFPLAQYAFSTALGYGFPSEILLAPGFFWICMFSIIQRPVPLIVLALSFAGLVFSHELALAAALLVIIFFRVSVRGLDGAPSIEFSKARIFLGTAGLILLVDIALILLGGGSGGNSNAIYVFNVRRVLHDPMLWIIAGAAIAAFTIACARARGRTLSVLSYVVACIAVTVYASRWFNFADGRYDSARTLIGLSMVGLGVLFAIIHVASEEPAAQQYWMPQISTFIRLAMPGVLAITFVANMIFLDEWGKGLAAFEQGVNAAQSGHGAVYLNENSMGAILGHDGLEYAKRAGFAWTWPYRSIVLAKNFHPHRIFVSSDAISGLCGSPRMTRFEDSRVPAGVTAGLEHYACLQAMQPAHTTNRPPPLI